MDRLLLIDGSSILSSSFFATLDTRYHKARTPEERQVFLDKLMRGSDGVPTNGVYGMLKSIEGLLTKADFSHVVVAWDISRNTFRRKLYAEYKGTRKDTLPELKVQFKLAQNVMKELGVSQYMFDEYEADDVIGTLAEMFKENTPVTIWTKDQDALQLIDENTNVWLITSKADAYYDEIYGTEHIKCPVTSIFPFNEYSFEHIYGMKPIQLIDKKAIEGDTSDNIPGIRGVGEKTATALIQEFGSLESIYEVLESSTEKELKEIFSEIGISSPLKKMMKEITFSEVAEELVSIMSGICDIIYPEELCGVDLVQELLDIEAGDKKTFKGVLKHLSGYAECKEIIDRIGTFVPGEAKEIAFLSKTLATIIRDIPELKNVTLNDLVLNISDETRTDVYGKYEFKSLLK